MEVPGEPGVFVLGSLERRVTLYSQQVRALNLIHALFEQGRLRQGERVAVVGGGGAGIMAAAGASLKGCKVSLLEQMQTLLPLFQGNRTRWLHPHIYDWPEVGSENDQADLPVLNWRAGLAGEVASQILDEFNVLSSRLGVQVYYDVKDLTVQPDQGKGCLLSWNTTRFHRERFSAVVLAVGFGLERHMEGVKYFSYWDNDNLHQPLRDPNSPLRRYLVSGTGDGGLVDLFRVRIEDFRHEVVVKKFLSAPSLEEVKRALLVIEDDVQKKRLTDDEIYERYLALPVPTALDDSLSRYLRKDTEAVLNGLDESPLSARACTLNRFLASRLLHIKGGATYKSGEFKVSRDERGYEVGFSNSNSNRTERFDDIIVRHGPQPALEKGFQSIWSRVRERMGALAMLDQTRRPIWKFEDFAGLSQKPISNLSINAGMESAELHAPQLSASQIDSGRDGTPTGKVGKRKSQKIRREGVSQSQLGSRSPVVQESEFRRWFEAALSPWSVKSWAKNELGDFALVEILNADLGENRHTPTGRLFAAQLFLAEGPDAPASISIRPGHLKYWLEHSLPMLLVSVHVPTRTMRALWANAAVYERLKSRNPTFWSQETVSIDIDQGIELGPQAQIVIDDAVARFRPSGPLLSPSRYFESRSHVTQVARQLEEIGRESGFESAKQLVERIRKTLKTSAYTVAISGPQRVGKSTLVNAILGSEISPVAEYPTTAVPIVFEPGEKMGALVLFADGTELAVEASEVALRPYAAQQENESNSKKVRLIRVTLPNDALAQGVTLIDTPGLHDASESVREVTEAALGEADAVLYVLDASLGAKFKLGQAEINDLKTLQKRKERLLILLNQSDGLAFEQRERLGGYVQQQLARYDLEKGLPTPPMFVSGKQAWNARQRHEAVPDEFALVEDQLWGHLLRSRATGFYRLQVAVGLLREGADDLAGLLSERATNGVEAARLDQAKKTCVDAISRAHRLCQLEIDKARGVVSQLLGRRYNFCVDSWKQTLSKIPLNGSFPTAVEVEKLLRADIAMSRQEVWNTLGLAVEQLGARLNEEVRAALKDAKVQLGLPTSVSIVTPPLPQMSAVDLSLPEAQFGFWSGLLGFLLSPGVGAITTIFGLIVGNNVAVSRRHQRVTKKLVQEYSKHLMQAHEQLARQAEERLFNAVNSLYSQMSGRLETFIVDAGHRIKGLGNPVGKKESERLRTLRDQVLLMQRQLDDLGLELARITGGRVSSSE